MKSNVKKGFTLIELLVVIVIIGILATIGVAQFSSYFAKARDAKRTTAVSQVRSIIMAESVENSGDYSQITVPFTSLANNGFSVATESGYAYGYAATATDFVVYVCSEANPDTVISAGSDTSGITCSGTTATVGAPYDSATITDADLSTVALD